MLLKLRKVNNTLKASFKEINSLYNCILITSGR